jgi:predicted nuclease of restriction endonuclease-like (RecB) superfamily
MSNSLGRDSSYKDWLKELKQRIRRSQTRAALHVNAALMELYWSIGSDIVSLQAEKAWGSGVVARLSRDLREEFPEINGFSITNLRYAKRFYLAYQEFATKLVANSSEAIRHQLGGELEQADAAATGDTVNEAIDDEGGAMPPILAAVPWRHHVEIFSKTASLDEALFYINKTIEEGRSRTVHVNNQRSDLHSPQGKPPNIFTRLLPCPQSDLAQEIIKDPYNFDFITLAKKHRERELQDALTDNLSKLMLELGQGFAYVGKRVNLVVGSKELEIDVLFYHMRLHCYVVVELKVEEFEASFMGQLGTYVSAVDELLRTDVDNPTIGLLICKTKDNVYAEYALKGSSKPIGVSTYEITELLPEDVRPSLPTIEEIEAALSDEE